MTPCDTPAVLHSGTRSNALHFAAQSGSVGMTQKVLDAIQNPALMLKMYPAESAESRCGEAKSPLKSGVNVIITVFGQIFLQIKCFA
jgi:hypothetical protein